jgi:hypothetical protein
MVLLKYINGMNNDMPWNLLGNGGINPATNFLGTTDNHPLIIKTNGTEAMHIDPSSNIGIGTGTPQVKLHVKGNLTRLESTDGVRKLDLRADGMALSIEGTGAHLSMNARGQNLYLNQDGGNVGIGTTQPRTMLHVFDRISTGLDFNSAGAITFFPPDGFAWFHIDNGPSGGRPLGRLRFSFGVNPGDHEVLSIYQSGAVGIGTGAQDPSIWGEIFTVNGAADVNGHGSFNGYGEFNGNGDFNGDLTVNGTVTKAGGGFKIDHPLDPANKYLNHGFVESDNMKNIYDGVAVLNENGEATVELPEWFEAVNHDVRYQLTAIGAPGPNLYIQHEISNNRFSIAGGAKNMKVSWQVTGIRKDPWAKLHSLPTEEKKQHNDQGLYLHPDLYDQPQTKQMKSVHFVKTINT